MAAQPEEMATNSSGDYQTSLNISIRTNLYKVHQ